MSNVEDNFVINIMTASNIEIRFWQKFERKWLHSSITVALTLMARWSSEFPRTGGENSAATAGVFRREAAAASVRRL